MEHEANVWVATKQLISILENRARRDFDLKNYKLMTLQKYTQHVASGETIGTITFDVIPLCYVLMNRNRDLEIILNAIIPRPRDFAPPIHIELISAFDFHGILGQ